MSYGSKTVVKKGSVTDDSCTVEFIEIVPLETAAGEPHARTVNCYLVSEVEPEVLQPWQEIKQEPADKNENEDSNCTVKHKLAHEHDAESACFTAQVSQLAVRF